MSFVSKILIVDDDHRMCDSLKELLSSQSYEMETSNSAKEAIKYLEKNIFDLVLLDIFMPDENGYQVMDYITSQSLDALVIIMTGHASAESAIKALRKGAHDYIKKPFEPEELLARVENALNHNSLKSDRKQAENALRESEEKYRLLVKNIPSIVYKGYQDWSVEFIDEKIELLAGYKSDEFNSRRIKWNDLIIKEDIEIVRERFIDALKTDKSYVREYRIISKAGDICWIQERGQIVCDNKGKIEYVNGVFFDITERKRVEGALRESEEKYRSMMESMTDAVYICSPDFRVEYMNPAMIKRTERGATGELCYKEINALDAKCPLCVHDKVQKGEYAVTEIISPKDGRTYSVSHSPIHHVNGSISKLTIYRDLTELKKMEEELLKAKKLESIGILSGGIAHDFNNLLSIIMGNIFLAKDDVKPEYGVVEFLNEAEKAALRAQELTKQLITFSKGGAPVKKAGSICDLVKEITDFALSDSKVESKLTIPHDLWLVEFDEGQMKHVVKNIIGNSVEAMPDSGTIDIRAENFNITGEQGLPFPEGKYVKISVQDHGVGIPEEHLSMVFDPYFSSKEMGTQKGMGLGLATTYSIINRHDGHITVESEVGVGTTFILYLPAHEKGVSELEPIEIPKPEKFEIHTGRILLMDDEESIRKVTKQMLSRLGYDSDFAKGGTEAIELYNRAIESGKPFDIVILDLTIKGGMGGVDTIKKLIEIDPQVRAVVSSGYSNDPAMTDFRKYGFIEALPKPYTMKDLSETLIKITKD